MISFGEDHRTENERMQQPTNMGGSGNSKIHSKGTLGNMEIRRLNSCPGGPKCFWFLIFFYGSSNNHPIYGSSETLKMVPLCYRSQKPY